MSDHLPEHAVYEALRDALRAEEPVALATVTVGPGIGAKLLVRPGGEHLGTLGDPDLDRVVARDALGELESGLTSTRHYGPHGEAREDDGHVVAQRVAEGVEHWCSGHGRATSPTVRGRDGWCRRT